MNRKFLLTGATGFVGRQILQNLLKKKITVRVITRKRKNFFLNNKNSKIELIKTNDLFKENVDWWAEQCKGIDTVIHVAWYVEPNKYLQSVKNIDCLKGSLNLAKGAARSGIKRFIAIGSCFEYDLCFGDLSIHTPLKPSTLYAKSKVKLYKSLSRLLPTKSIEFSWCRLFYLYGEGEDERKLNAYLHSKLSKNQTVKLTGGTQIRDFLDVSEAGKLIVNLAISKHQGPVNICSGIPITVRQFAEKIADEYGCRDLLKFGAKPDNLIDPPRIVGLPTIINL